MSRSDPRERDGNAIARRRLEMGMTQGELADRLGVKREALSRWENSRAVPKIDALLKMSKVLDCTVEDLIDSTLVPDTPK